MHEEKTVDMDILVRSRNGDRKIVHSVRMPSSRKMKWSHLSQFG